MVGNHMIGVGSRQNNTGSKLGATNQNSIHHGVSHRDVGAMNSALKGTVGSDIVKRSAAWTGAVSRQIGQVNVPANNGAPTKQGKTKKSSPFPQAQMNQRPEDPERQSERKRSSGRGGQSDVTDGADTPESAVLEPDEALEGLADLVLDESLTDADTDIDLESDAESESASDEAGSGSVKADDRRNESQISRNQRGGSGAGGEQESSADDVQTEAEVTKDTATSDRCDSKSVFSSVLNGADEASNTDVKSQDAQILQSDAEGAEFEVLTQQTEASALVEASAGESTLEQSSLEDVDSTAETEESTASEQESASSESTGESASTSRLGSASSSGSKFEAADGLDRALGGGVGSLDDASQEPTAADSTFNDVILRVMEDATSMTAFSEKAASGEEQAAAASENNTLEVQDDEQASESSNSSDSTVSREGDAEMALNTASALPVASLSNGAQYGGGNGGNDDAFELAQGAAQSNTSSKPLSNHASKSHAHDEDEDEDDRVDANDDINGRIGGNHFSNPNPLPPVVMPDESGDSSLAGSNGEPPVTGRANPTIGGQTSNTAVEPAVMPTPDDNLSSGKGATNGGGINSGGATSNGGATSSGGTTSNGGAINIGGSNNGAAYTGHTNSGSAGTTTSGSSGNQHNVAAGTNQSQQPTAIALTPNVQNGGQGQSSSQAWRAQQSAVSGTITQGAGAGTYARQPGGNAHSTQARSNNAKPSASDQSHSNRTDNQSNRSDNQSNRTDDQSNRTDDQSNRTDSQSNQVENKHQDNSELQSPEAMKAQQAEGSPVAEQQLYNGLPYNVYLRRLAMDVMETQAQVKGELELQAIIEASAEGGIGQDLVSANLSGEVASVAPSTVIDSELIAHSERSGVVLSAEASDQAVSQSVEAPTSASTPTSVAPSTAMSSTAMSSTEMSATEMPPAAMPVAADTGDLTITEGGVERLQLSGRDQVGTDLAGSETPIEATSAGVEGLDLPGGASPELVRALAQMSKTTGAKGDLSQTLANLEEGDYLDLPIDELQALSETDETEGQLSDQEQQGNSAEDLESLIAKDAVGKRRENSEGMKVNTTIGDVILDNVLTNNASSAVAVENKSLTTEISRLVSSVEAFYYQSEGVEGKNGGSALEEGVSLQLRGERFQKIGDSTLKCHLIDGKLVVEFQCDELFGVEYLMENHDKLVDELSRRFQDVDITLMVNGSELSVAEESTLTGEDSQAALQGDSGGSAGDDSGASMMEMFEESADEKQRFAKQRSGVASGMFGGVTRGANSGR